MTWKIQAVTGDLAGQEISIERDMLVGRHQSADIVLQQAEISRKHAAFLLKEQALWVQDLNSSNGTFVNDARLENAEALLKGGDTVQFAGLKFAVLQPAEAASAAAQPEAAAQKMNDQGMPELAERDAGVQLSRDGMPQHVAVPKPAPIPESADLSAVQPEPAPAAAEQPAARAEQETEQRKNASVGLMTVAAIIILAILAWLFLK
ncbi:FHA domain-containing protein [Acinetobacter sp.]|uniref:FHA domain-containing protein n=1 Tax=Acinetobacter sp. TaxID=472 RepID=UPI0035AF34D6